MASSAAQADLLLENPFYEGVRETFLFATTPLSIKQKIVCRPGRGWGRGPAPLRRAWRGATGRSAATRFFGTYCIKGGLEKSLFAPRILPPTGEAARQAYRQS